MLSLVALSRPKIVPSMHSCSQSSALSSFVLVSFSDGKLPWLLVEFCVYFLFPSWRVCPFDLCSSCACCLGLCEFTWVLLLFREQFIPFLLSHFLCPWFPSSLLVNLCFSPTSAFVWHQVQPSRSTDPWMHGPDITCSFPPVSKVTS